MLLFFIIFIVCSAAFAFIAAYWQSDKILYRRNKRTPIKFTPAQYNLKYEEASFKNEDGITLQGWFVPASVKSDKTILLLHGWRMNKGDILANTVFLSGRFNVFYLEFRGSGASDNGITSIGYLETRDAQAAINFIKKKYAVYAKKLGVYGLSMGAAVGVYAAARNKIIKCVIAESCYYSYSKVVARWARIHKHISYFPMVALVLFFARLRFGVNPEKFSPKENIGKLAGRRLLLLNGAQDALSTRTDARKLFAQAKEPKEFWLVAGAGHIECGATMGWQYKERLSGFYNQYLK
jgi:pimeloyl-ACP methyl ester carboxylesterase